MNINNFRECLETYSSTGMRLSFHNAELIEHSLIIVQSENKFQEMFFWGQLNGIENDYWIAFGYSRDCLRDRRFFYSTNGYDWILLQKFKKKLQTVCRTCISPLSGDPTVIVNVTMDPIFDEQRQSLIPEVCKLKEEDRLAYLVHSITNESAVVPRGSLYKSTDKRCNSNITFRGLAGSEATNLKNYQLYRPAQALWSDNLLNRNFYNYAIDIFDAAASLIPENRSFAIADPNNRGIVFIKSLLWPGMIAFHKTQTPAYGFAYFGNGKPNLNVLFMF